MNLAAASGQSFAEMLTWHPRDVATLVELFEARIEKDEDEASEARFAAARRQLVQGG